MKYWLKDSDEYPIFEVEIEKLDEYFCDFTQNRQERCHLLRWLMNCRNLLLTIII